MANRRRMTTKWRPLRDIGRGLQGQRSGSAYAEGGGAEEPGKETEASGALVQEAKNLKKE
jgi:hypothetical protein